MRKVVEVVFTGVKSSIHRKEKPTILLTSPGVMSMGVTSKRRTRSLARSVLVVTTVVRGVGTLRGLVMDKRACRGV